MDAQSAVGKLYCGWADYPNQAGGKTCPGVLDAAGLDKPALLVPAELYLCAPFEEGVLDKYDDRLLASDAMEIEKYVTPRRDSIPHLISWPVQNRDYSARPAAERLDPHN